MKAVCWYGKHNVQVMKVPDPSILNPRDAIVKITRSRVAGQSIALDAIVKFTRSRVAGQFIVLDAIVKFTRSWVAGQFIALDAIVKFTRSWVVGQSIVLDVIMKFIHLRVGEIFSIQYVMVLHTVFP